MSNRSLGRHLWYHFIRLTLRVLGTLYFRLRYSGAENIPSTGGLLVCSNHQSHLDPPLVGMGSPRMMNFMARDTLFRFRPFAWFIRSINAFPIDRDGVGLAGIKQALRFLKDGEVVVIFPEGTRSSDGEIAKFRPGFATLATRTKAAILPVAIEGAFDAFPRTRKFPLSRTIHVIYGKPILPHETAGLTDQQLVAEVEQRIREYQAELRQRPVFARGKCSRKSP